jgi:V8-like Glu-specific endopeptidase
LAAGIQPKVVYGIDNRQEVTGLTGLRARNADSTVALVETSSIVAGPKGSSRLKAPTLASTYGLCARERYRNQPTAAFCSGFLAGPDIVVTAGHCVSKWTLATTRFVFGYRVTSSGAVRTTISNSDIYRGVKVLANQVGDADFAVVRLDRKVAGHAALPFQRSGGVKSGTPLYVIGYPSGLPAKIAPGAKVLKVTSNYFTANLDTYGGNSGSPVFHAGNHTVLGVLVRGSPDFVTRGNCWVTNVLPDAKGFEDTTRMAKIMPFLPK